MDEDIRIVTEILSLCNSIKDKLTESELVSFDNINDLSRSFMKLYQSERLKLPYHINIVDLLGANENAHSRILMKLLQQKSGRKYEVLENFLEFLTGKKPNFRLPIDKPEITSEKHRIDLLVQDKEYAIVFENKIHGAVDQKEQIKRYIDIVNTKYSKDQIYILYLIRDDGKSPEVQSWGGYKDEFSDRYLIISYRDDILSWLKESLLPNCKLKDIYLRSTIEQYIDHLEGIFNSRKINDNMNAELQNHIKRELGLDSTPNENHAKLVKKLEDLNKVKDQIAYLKRETEKECWEEWIRALEKDYPHLELVDYSKAERFPKVGVLFEYKGSKFAVLLEMESNIYYGIGRHHSSMKLDSEVKDLVKPLMDGFKESDWWYGWKYTSFKNGYSRLKELINDVEDRLK